MGKLWSIVCRVAASALPARYTGRLDRLGSEAQQDAITNRFRSGI